jgi:penicillin-binding protein 1A
MEVMEIPIILEKSSNDKKPKMNIGISNLTGGGLALFLILVITLTLNMGESWSESNDTSDEPVAGKSTDKPLDKPTFGETFMMGLKKFHSSVPTPTPPVTPTPESTPVPRTTPDCPEAGAEICDEETSPDEPIYSNGNTNGEGDDDTGGDGTENNRDGNGDGSNGDGDNEGNGDSNNNGEVFE